MKKKKIPNLGNIFKDGLKKREKERKISHGLHISYELKQSVF